MEVPNNGNEDHHMNINDLVEAMQQIVDLDELKDFVEDQKALDNFNINAKNEVS